MPDTLVDLEVIDDPAKAQAVLDPTRAAVLAELREPGSATTVAESLGQPRQKINYHLRALEELELLRLVEERPRRGLTERIVMASARSYVLSPSVLGVSAADPDRTDRFSTAYLIALAARMVREVADLARGAEASGKPLATLSLDAEIRFASAGQRAAFTEELSRAVNGLVARYHDESARNGRWHRLVVGAHPLTKDRTQQRKG